MKTVTVEDFQANPGQYLDFAEQETVVITRGGKPCAVLHGVPDDLESAELAHSAEFWSMIEQRRGEPTIPWEDAKQKLG
ncbi:MAG: type II toxin-antitoxin system Phd/YefM family antitoxin [Planctomycetes bacterium]|nr:type II toxin-antitoxin system Phd/YefM family antitoxin [Planctomycetota bacterium]